MSYAGPAGQKNAARPTARRPAGGAAAATAAAAASDSERNVAFIAGVVFGAVVGAGAALLLAPRSGRSTRRRLARSGHRLSSRGRDAWHDLADEFRDIRRRRRHRRDAANAADADAGDAESNRGGQRRSFSFRAASSL